MRNPLFPLFLLTLAAVPAHELPKGISVSTWVREDLFAGYLDADMARFGAGMEKLSAILAKNPKAADALAWKASGELFLAVRAHEAGDAAGFAAGYAQAKSTFAAAEEIVKRVPQYAPPFYAVQGGIALLTGDRVPQEHRRESWLRLRESYTQLREIQKDRFDKFPVHFRGEVLAGLAQAAQRLGETEKARELAQQVVTALPGTPYAVFAKRWLDNPEAMAKSKLACATCHDAGRLENVRKAAAGN
jgi:tetratricopeptide (TPR) repeat protein